MKKLLTLIIMVLAVAIAMAQAPENFSFQAVVRNANNSLVANAQVGVRVNILQGSATGNAVYSESHVTSSNANGLITVNIGGGSVLHGSFEGIDWSDGPYFLKTDIDPNGGNDYTITSVQQLLSVPYALYAKEAANSFSGDYNDLTNVPAIPTVPTNVSAFTNDAGYITAGQVPAQVNADWNATSGAAEILNKPTIPTVPTNVSAFTNDAGYITGYTETDPQFTAWDKDYNDLINKPAIPTVPTNVSAFTNDAGYITSAGIPAIPTVPTNVSAFTNDAGYITAAQVPAQVNADWNATSGAAQILNKPALFSGNYNDLTNKPVLFSGNYNDLTNKPTLFDGNYNSLTNRPNLAAVATSGNYNDLINKPTIPTAVGELTNNVGYITLSQIPAQMNADWNATSGAAQILNKPTLFSGNYNDLTNKPVLFSGDYNDLTNLPQIPQIPADISAFNNDAGYLTSYTETDPQFNAWDKDYNDLINKPTIPTVPTNVSAFDNDAGYVTANDIPAYQVLSISNDTIYLSNGGYAVLPPGFDGDYNSLTNRPNLFSGSYNDLTDTPTIPTVPTNVSAFTNDAGYLTEYTEQQVLSISHDTLFLTGGSFVKLPAGFDGDYNSLTNKPELFSGDYNDLTNLPQIPQIPADISAFTNDAGYITGYTETDPQFNAWDKDYNDLINKPAIPAVPTNVSAFTNDAGYITAANVQEAANIPTNVSAFNNDAGYITSEDIPEIPTVPTNVGAFTNDAGYLTNYTETDPEFNAWDKNYNDLINKPVIPAVPTNVSAFTNDAGYITAANVQEAANIPTNVSAFNNDAGYITSEDIPEIPTVPTNVSAFTNDAGYITSYTETDPEFNAWDKNYNDLTNKPNLFSGNYNDLTNKPTLFDGNYNSLINKPNLATVATTGNYNDLVNKPALFSGNYNDLTNKPTIPTVNNATLTIQRNGSNVGTFTANQNTNQTVNITVPTTTSQLTNNSGYITSADIPSIPTNVSQLNNDAGYITAEQCGNVDLCALADLVNALQQQVADLQAQLDSVGLIVDTAITHIGFHCGISTVTDYDGNIYNTVKIGDQCWMKENLRTTHYPDGDEISELHYPNNEIGNVNTYGYLYRWDAMMHGASSTNDNPSGVQGICPTGWHVPSDAEWMQLTDYVKGQSVFVCGSDNNNIAKSLAASTDWDTDTADCTVGNNLTVNDATGFGALPAGYTLLSYSYNFGNNARYWSSTLKYTTSACYCNFSSNNSTVERPSASIGWAAYSVRCVLGEGTAAELPTVTTSAVSNITENAVACGGEVVACGGADVTARGVCWSISPNPTVNDSHTTDGNGIGSFTSSITGLEVGIPYYVRAYATNSAGTVYGEEIKISIPSVNDAMPCSSNPTVTDYDGNVYNTVQIGAQCWMKENLRTTHYPDGAEIPMGTTASNTESFRYNPNNNANTVNTYGYLYNWPAVMHGAASSNSNPSGVQGVCPSGWHVPSDAEWTQLTDYVSCQSGYVCGTNSSFIAKALAATIGWASDTAYCAVGNDQTNNNATGFTALPAGYCWGYYGSFTYQQYGSHAFYSSSTQSSSSRAYGRFLKHDFAEVVVNYNDNKLCGLSVRCVLGEGTAAELPTVTTSAVSNITENAATCGGEVVTDGGADVTARGVCWSTSQNPTVSDSHTTDGSGMGSFSSSISGLTANTTYYVRAYATNSAGTAYGNEVSFTTLSAAAIDSKSCPEAQTVTDHEGNVYATVKIGDQCWMRDNLRTTTSPSTGTYLIPAANANYTFTGKQARWYNNDSATYAPMNYGLLYNWNAAVDTFKTAFGETSVNTSSVDAVSVTFNGPRRGICPAGWHLPSDAEWTQLTNYVSGQSEYTCDSNSNYIAKALASTVGWNSSSSSCAVGNDPSTNNATGFSAVPAGHCGGSSFGGAGNHAAFWSSTQYNSYSAYTRGLYYYYAYVDRFGSNGKSTGRFIRCLRD